MFMLPNSLINNRRSNKICNYISKYLWKVRNITIKNTVMY